MSHRFCHFAAAVVAVAAFSACDSQQDATSPSGSSASAAATALCNDGTLSYSKTASGTCSGHGGVKTWYHHP